MMLFQRSCFHPHKKASACWLRSNRRMLFIMNIPGDSDWQGFQRLQNMQHSFPLRPVTWAKRFPALLGIRSSIVSDLTYLQLPVSERSDNDKKAPVRAVLVPGLSINE